MAGGNQLSHLKMASSFSGFRDEYEFNDDESDLSDREYCKDLASDSGTEDASETDMVKMEEEFTEIKEQMYQDKLASLKTQLKQLQEGSHIEYNKQLKKLEVQYRERKRLAEIYHAYAVTAIDQEYINEKKAAVKEFEEKKIELKENLIIELDEKKRMVDGERHSMELTGDSMEVKPVTTRKLRRRPHDPPPIANKVGRKNGVSTLNIVLSDTDIADDMKVIAKGKGLSSTGVKKPNPSISTDTQPEYRIEDGKLFYEKKWFHRGNAIFLEGKDIGKISAVISAIGANEFCVRKVTDSTKMKIFLSQLQKAKYTIRRRTNTS
ncbi:PREDICTED: sin3 histone deacetylase corepressor complex component SDS3-like [Priapulus caudatus]|uniref:Sin3 histone deacetylase corepressor complex component SDS3-like n=1 Tax=Priapulus caudatus TaxID=37621 RepID=A0ABM1F1A6_PRICU|nr:PREDICTED: sin3 histone deacetylase corepressor complex component SDS3-like [Priapulus caudatus]